VNRERAKEKKSQRENRRRNEDTFVFEKEGMSKKIHAKFFPTLSLFPPREKTKENKRKRNNATRG
jgi:hypothetical protein|tara:strand:- start:4411 stop:4605 length:195 start_codon:yes stop_codon:yes gene_type:complete